jgi:hypothetical protein
VKELEQAGVSIRFLNPISPGILLARMESSQP